ncbi:trypsin-like serine protease [Corynebacterium hiratae]|uniref:trypsin-like serine protease n=1 Tax=Corynebacterium hiratae TaxID=3139423 RepID=UPI00163DE1DE|nr:trypsin-like serine protease [Corynebacterium aurimucosum]
MFPGILASLLSIIVTVTSSLFGASTSVNVPGVLQATSTVAASDDRVAALWRNGKRECSAGYIGNDWWLTASHCLGRDLRLTQADGDSAKVLASTPVAEKSDVALLKAEPMDAEAFELPSRPLRVNDSLFLVGYGGMHNFASEAVVRVEETGVAGEIQGYDFDNLIQSRSMFASRTCNGDSGAPLYQDTMIFAVHTGGEENEECTDGTRRHMWHSEIYPNLQSLRTLMDSYDDFDSPAAFEEAKKHAQTQKKESKRSSSLSSLSSW